MMNKNILLCLIFIFVSTNIWSLDIDEKLTVRFLKLSSTKKTVLVNRGAEDGLVIGDHAKFFITNGIVARGVVEKVSPSRSVWSIYRIVLEDEMVENKVLNLKIASPVKVTESETPTAKPVPVETIKETPKLEKTQSAMDEKEELDGITVADNSEIPKKKESAKSSKSKKVVEVETDFSSGSKQWEIFGTIGKSSLTNSSSDSTSTALSLLDLSIGIEKSFAKQSSFKSVSLFGVLLKRSSSNTTTVTSNSDWMQFGGGLNYFFYNQSLDLNRIIGFGTLSVGMGTTTIVTDSATTKGSNTFINFGIGGKYNLGAFGTRFGIEYNMINETYEIENAASITNKLSGPRFLVGGSFRF